VNNYGDKLDFSTDLTVNLYKSSLSMSTLYLAFAVNYATCCMYGLNERTLLPFPAPPARPHNESPHPFVCGNCEPDTWKPEVKPEYEHITKRQAEGYAIGALCAYHLWLPMGI